VSATVEGIVRITNRASPALKEIKTDSTAATRATEKLGNSSDVMARKMRVNSDQMARAVKKATSSAKNDVDGLKRAIEVLDKIKANPHIDVDTGAASAKIRILKQELRSIETKQARSELEALGVVAAKTATAIGGGGGPGVPGGGGGGGGGPVGLASSFAAAASKGMLMVGVMVLAAPAILAVGGAVAALVGSLGMAVGGAGILGAGLIGGLAVGMGAIAAAAIPAAKGIGETKKAQDAYNKSVEQYGDKSAQAIKAHEALLKAYEKTPGSRRLLGNLKDLQSGWRGKTGPARNDFIGMLNDGLETANKLMPTFATTANSAMGSARRAVGGLLARLESPGARNTIRILGQTFSQSIGPFVNGVGNIATFFGRIATHASPSVIHLFESFDSMTARMARRAGGMGAGSMMGSMLGQLGSWVDLLKSAGRLALTFFGMGANQGQSLVEDITGQLNKWTDWLEANPQKVERFFDQAIGATEDLAGALGTIATVLFQISNTLIPVLSGFTQFTSMLGPDTLGALGLLAGARFAGGKVAAAGLGGLLGRGAAKGAASAAGGGAAAAAGGAAAATGARLGVRGVAGGFGKGLLRKAGPVALAMGAYDFATSNGGFGNRLGGAVNAAAFGIPNALGAHWGQAAPTPTAAMRADAYLSHPDHQNPASIANRMGRLRQTRDQVSYRVDSATGNAVKVGLKLSPDARRDIQKEIDALKPKLNLAVKGRAADQAGGLIDAFGIRETGKGENAARKGLFEGLNRELKDMGPKGKTALLKNMADWQAVLEDGTGKQRRTAGRLGDYIERRFERMGRTVNVVNGKILTGSQEEWGNIRKALSSEAERARQEVSRAFTDIQREAAGSLMSMGYSRGEANSLIKARETGGTAGAQKVATGIGASHGDTGANRASDAARVAAPVRPALGARIPGVGSADYVKLGGNAIGAPGELVVNRHTEYKADQKLGYNGALAGLVNGETTPHGVQVSRHATGGRTSGDLASGGARAGRSGRTASGIQGISNAVLAQFPGLSVTSTTGGNHAKNSYHYKGMAVDIGGPSGLMDAASAWLAQNYGGSLLEGIHNPNLSIKDGHGVDPSFWGASTWAGHANHIHLAAAGAAMKAMIGSMGANGGLGAMAAPTLKRRESKSRGVPGALAQAAIDAMTSGAQGRLDAAVGGGSGAGGGSASGPSNVRQMVIAGLRLAGVPATPGNVAAQMRLTMGESGGRNVAQGIQDVNSTNGSGGAKGVAQMIQSTFDAHAVPGHTNIWNTVDNEAASVRYQMSRYGKLVGHSGYAMGGRLPGLIQMGDGGSFTTNGVPQMMQVGERGQRERVKVTRESAGGSGFGSDGGIHITIGRIDYRHDGDIEQKVKEEFKKAARAMRNMPIDGEGEL
jgi:hypothetical protein